MNLVEIASHTIDLDAVRELPVVLDVGCRGFGFGREMLSYRPGACVVAMDPDPEMPLDNSQDMVFLCEALVAGDRCESLYATHSTGEGNFLCDVVPHYARSLTVPCVNITQLMERLGIVHWDVIKLDCEGSEFEILENWPGPIAEQISVEFHDWTGEPELRCKNDPAYYPALFAGPLKDYDVVQHELSTVGPNPAWGHWDSLLRLKAGVR
jgi:FkbM family methyltransferase